MRYMEWTPSLPIKNCLVCHLRPVTPYDWRHSVCFYKKIEYVCSWLKNQISIYCIEKATHQLTTLLDIWSIMRLQFLSSFYSCTKIRNIQSEYLTSLLYRNQQWYGHKISSNSRYILPCLSKSVIEWCELSKKTNNYI